MFISTGSHYEIKIVFLDKMIIWNDKLEENLGEMNLGDPWLIEILLRTTVGFQFSTA